MVATVGGNPSLDLITDAAFGPWRTAVRESRSARTAD
jgi:hypothetical protein